MRKIHVFAVAVFALILCGVGLSLFVRYTREASPLEELHSSRQLQDWPIAITYSLGQNGADAEVCRDLEENGAAYAESALTSPVILLVRPTDRIAQNGDIFMQEAQVLQVLKAPKAAAPEEGETVRIFRPYDCFSGSGKRLRFSSAKNIMYGENTYYVFLQPMALNEYSGYGDYTLCSPVYFSCLKAEGENQDGALTGDDFNENRNRDIFCATDAVYAAYDKVAQMMVSRLEGGAPDFASADFASAD